MKLMLSRTNLMDSLHSGHFGKIVSGIEGGSHGTQENVRRVFKAPLLFRSHNYVMPPWVEAENRQRGCTFDR